MTTLIDLTEPTDRVHEAQSLAPVIALDAGERSHRIARFEAPSRFDVHQVPAFEQWVAHEVSTGAERLVLECSAVDFVDHAMLEAIDRTRLRTRLDLADTSLAMTITLQLVQTTDATMAVAA